MIRSIPSKAMINTQAVPKGINMTLITGQYDSLKIILYITNSDMKVWMFIVITNAQATASTVFQ